MRPEREQKRPGVASDMIVQFGKLCTTMLLPADPGEPIYCAGPAEGKTCVSTTE